MKKYKFCKHCKGTGTEYFIICDNCGQKKDCGQHEGKEICQDCWAATLTQEDINNL